MTIPEHCDLAVIGGGPAGLAAATEAARFGLSVVLLDEQERPGGQIYRAIETAPPIRRNWLGKDYADGAALVSAFHASGATYVPGAMVWDVTPDRWVSILHGGATYFLQAARIILASGALERPFPIPGWTLPGVSTAGAAQILMKASGVAPPQDAVLAGSGPLLYLLAWQLARAGAPPRALLDTTTAANYRRALPLLPAALGSGGGLFKGVRLLAGLRAAGVRHIKAVDSLRAGGGERVEAVHFRRGDIADTIATGCLLLHQGVVPNIQLSRALRCDHRWDPVQLCWRPETDSWHRSSVSGIAIAGDGGGIGGALSAALSGRIAAAGIACELDRIDTATRDRAAAPWQTALRRDMRLRPFLDTLYRPADSLRIPADDVIACRCEEITAGEIRRMTRLGAQGPNQLKAFTRAGMGPCQGRMCGLTVCETMAQERGVNPADVGYYRLRPPIKPMTLGTLATMAAPAVAADADETASETAAQSAH